MFRVSIRQLLAITAYFGVLFASLKFSGAFFLHVWGSFTLFLLVVSLSGTFIARGPCRAFWIGFFVFGFAYLLLTFCPILNGFQSLLPTPGLFRQLSEAFPYRFQHSGTVVPYAQIFQHGYSFVETIAHLALANMLAVAGGLIGRWIDSRSRAETER